LLIQNYTSHAKINLGLQVLNKREDGYHNLHSLFLEIDLADELSFREASELKLGIEGADLPLDENNLITKAYRLIRSKVEDVQSEYSIHLKKKIPLGGGLGGGSSNAATVLITLNQLWKLNLTEDELENMSKSLGADVPFFIRGGIQLIEGIGDRLSLVDPTPLKDLQFILVVPPVHISTTWAYRALNKTLQPDKSHPKFSPLSKPMKWELFDNDFERVIRKTYPEVGKIKENLQSAGALYAGLSGSGSTVFGVFDNLQKAEAILGNFSQYQTFLTSPVIR
jgi:4-diphosphocytidyl-2-C-methyl-D-erythritol kinase